MPMKYFKPSIWIYPPKYYCHWTQKLLILVQEGFSNYHTLKRSKSQGLKFGSLDKQYKNQKTNQENTVEFNLYKFRKLVIQGQRDEKNPSCFLSPMNHLKWRFLQFYHHIPPYWVEDIFHKILQDQP